MDHLISEQPHHLDESRHHLDLPKSPPRWTQIGLCKAVLPPSPVFSI